MSAYNNKMTKSEIIDSLIFEKKEWDEKIDKLEKFMDSYAFKKVEASEAVLLNVQLPLMKTYSHILLERINQLL